MHRMRMPGLWAILLALTLAAPLAACSGGAPAGRDGGADAGRDASEDGSEVPGPLYAGCGGDPFEAGACENDGCVDGELEERVLGIFRERLLATQGLSEAEYAERFALTDVSTMGDFVRIQLLFTLDWLVVREAFSPQIAGGAKASDEEIARAVDLVLPRGDAREYGAASLVSLDELQAAFDSCAPGAEIDYCHIRFENQTGRLVVTGIAVTDAGRDACVQIRVSPVTGEVLGCDTMGCTQT